MALDLLTVFGALPQVPLPMPSMSRLCAERGFYRLDWLKAAAKNKVRCWGFTGAAHQVVFVLPTFIELDDGKI
jgi:hypothetical protein